MREEILRNADLTDQILAALDGLGEQDAVNAIITAIPLASMAQVSQRSLPISPSCKTGGPQSWEVDDDQAKCRPYLEKPH